MADPVLICHCKEGDLCPTKQPQPLYLQIRADHPCYWVWASWWVNTFGNIATPYEAAVKETIVWYREHLRGKKKKYQDRKTIK